MSGKMSEKKSETVINTFKDIVKVTDDMIHGRLRSEVRDMAVDAVAASERAFASGGAGENPEKQPCEHVLQHGTCTEGKGYHSCRLS